MSVIYLCVCVCACVHKTAALPNAAIKHMIIFTFEINNEAPDPFALHSGWVKGVCYARLTFHKLQSIVASILHSWSCIITSPSGNKARSQ